MPWVSLGLGVSGRLGLSLPLAVVVGQRVAVVDGVVERDNGLLLLRVGLLHLSLLSLLDNGVGVVWVVASTVGEAMGVGVGSVDQVRVGIGLGFSLSGCKSGKRSYEESPDHLVRMAPM